MPRQTLITRATLDTIKAQIETLPKKDPETLSVNTSQALATLKPDILSLQKKGYTTPEIIAFLNQKGLKVSHSTFKKIITKGTRKGKSGDAAKTPTPVVT